MLVILTLFQAFFFIIFVMVICDPWCLMIPKTQWRLKMMVNIFSNKLFLKLRYICIYLDIMLLHTYIQYSINVTFLCTGKSKNLYDLLYCNILQWYRMKSTESPRYACTLFVFLLALHLEPTLINSEFHPCHCMSQQCLFYCWVVLYCMDIWPFHLFINTWISFRFWY